MNLDWSFKGIDMPNHYHEHVVLFWSCVWKLLYACAIHMWAGHFFLCAVHVRISRFSQIGEAFLSILPKNQDWEWVLGTIGDALIGNSGRPHIFAANGWLEHEYFSWCAAVVIFFPCNCQNTIIDLLHLDIHVSKRLSKHRSCIDLLHCIHVYYYWSIALRSCDQFIVSKRYGSKRFVDTCTFAVVLMVFWRQ